jgi:hypothetical protein
VEMFGIDLVHAVSCRTGFGVCASGASAIHPRPSSRLQT